MKYLFVHQNFPGQFQHLARHLAAIPGNEVVFVSQRLPRTIPGVRNVTYRPARSPGKKTHRYLHDAEAHVLNAQAVARVALQLKKAGFVPDVMVGHNGWGEIWYLKEVFPQTPLLGYFEFFYRLSGADVGFDPAAPVTVDTGPRLRTRNLGNLLGLEAADHGLCPTLWQKSVYPRRYHPMLDVIHEGIDTDLVQPNPHARLRLTHDLELTSADEVVTYVARNLEPYRGFASFMHALPRLLTKRPKAQVLIVGGDEVSYGARLPDGQSYRQKLTQELGDALDCSRVHFLGRVPYETYLTVLQVSSAHVYLTYPFVLSWSMLEAMSTGCLVIGSKTAPVEEVLRDGDNGLLVDFFDSGAIAERVGAVFEDRDQFRALCDNARRTVIERYDLKRTCLPAQLQLIARMPDMAA